MTGFSLAMVTFAVNISLTVYILTPKIRLKTNTPKQKVKLLS